MLYQQSKQCFGYCIIASVAHPYLVSTDFAFVCYKF